MDPPLINEGSFTTANPSLAEIWPFNNNNNTNANDNNDNSINGLLGLRMGSGGFGSALINDFLNQSRNNNVNNINNGGGGLIGGVNRDGSIEESTVTEQSGSVCRKRRENFSEVESSKLVSSTSSANELKESNGKRIKPSCSKDENANSKAGGEASSAGGKPAEKPVEPPKDYIHVRARRGQATDSHSLAERARREKISERMKILQDLVPGCNKVIGKALVLDEIINYIQSLQRQVEFLSMKLEAVNSGMIPSINGFHSKEMNQVGVPSFDAMFGAQAGREFTSATGGPQTEWLHMQLGGSFGTTS